MIAAALTAVLLVHQAQVPPAPPLAMTTSGEAPDTRGLAEALRSEPRDEAWASRIEAELTRAYQALPHAHAAERIIVTCARTLCEIQGEARTDAEPVRVSSLVSDLQSEAAIQPALDLGLESVVAKFGAIGDPRRVSFVTYWRRGA